jgi:ABC-type multidrug transport system ATPase subunit
MPPSVPSLRIDNLHFRWGDQPVFAGVNMRLGAGVAFLCGDESAGKTTLLRLLCGELVPDQGGFSLEAAQARPANSAHASQVFFVDPRNATLDGCTARAWLSEQAARFDGWDAPAVAAHIRGFGLEEHLDKTFYALSTGTRRKVCLAAALASGATLTLIDEPVSGLDKASVAYLAEVLSQSSAFAQRVVLIAHYAPLPGVKPAAVLNLSEDGLAYLG